MLVDLFSRLFCNVFGFLYPAYRSYKAIRTKDIREYQQWLMYWIIFAFFSTFEGLADLVVFWIPFYYELKMIFVLWLLLPQTRGAVYLYKQFVHAKLNEHEQDIDLLLDSTTTRMRSTSASLGRHAVTLASKAVLETLNKGQGILAEQIRAQGVNTLTVAAATAVTERVDVDGGSDVPSVPHNPVEEDFTVPTARVEAAPSNRSRRVAARNVAGTAPTLQPAPPKTAKVGGAASGAGAAGQVRQRRTRGAGGTSGVAPSTRAGKRSAQTAYAAAAGASEGGREAEYQQLLQEQAAHLELLKQQLAQSEEDKKKREAADAPAAAAGVAEAEKSWWWGWSSSS